jgi:cyanophycinase-like exopeptidase
MPPDYIRYFRASPQPTARGPVTAGLALLGGPPDGPPPEVDAAFTWLLAKSGWGRFVVIGSDGVDEYAHYLYDHLPPPHPLSVETFIIKSRDAASNPDIVASIGLADALFIQGGDQWDYIRMWKGTGVQQAIADVIARGVPIGGSSAGLAVLGEFVFSARNGTVYSSEALADPYHEGVTLDRDLIDAPRLPPYALLRNVITDSHFQDRQRMGRLLAFLARLAQDGWATAARAIAVDEMTAVLVEADGAARVVDNRPAEDRGAAYFLNTPGPPEICQPGQPLTYENVSVHRIGASDVDASFHLGNWEGQGGRRCRVSARQGMLAEIPTEGLAERNPNRG